MNIDGNVVESIVKRVVSQLSTETASAQTCPSGGDWGVFESMNDAVDAAVEAQREYLNHSMHDRACYVQAIRDVVLRGYLEGTGLSDDEVESELSKVDPIIDAGVDEAKGIYRDAGFAG